MPKREEEGVVDNKKNTRVIAFANQKGGVGKTTNTVQVGAALAQRGKKVLLMDLDENAGTTKHLGISADSNLYGTYEVLLGLEDPNDLVISRDPEEGFNLPKNLSVLIGSRKLSMLEKSLVEIDKHASVHDCLKKPLRLLDGKYDYVLLDLPPQMPAQNLAAYRAVPWFILCGIPQAFAMHGLNEAVLDINAVRKNETNPNVQVLGVVLGGIDRRTRLSRELTTYVERVFNRPHAIPRRLEPIIPTSQDLCNAQERGQTIFDYKHNSPVAQVYLELSKNMEKNLRRIEKENTQDVKELSDKEVRQISDEIRADLN